MLNLLYHLIHILIFKTSFQFLHHPIKGLLADMNLCACHKADKAFDRLFSSGGGVAGGETAVHIASNLHPAAVKRRALSDPKETFSLSPPPPMYVPPALTVE